MDIMNFREWIRKHEIQRRTLEAFWMNFDSYKEESQEDFEEVFWQYSKDKLKIHIDDISLHIKDLKYLAPNNNDLEYIEARVRMEYRNVLTGYYRIRYRLDGEIDDDFFISEWVGQRHYLSLGLLEDILEEIKQEQQEGLISIEEMRKLETIIVRHQYNIKDDFIKQYC